MTVTHLAVITSKPPVVVFHIHKIVSMMNGPSDVSDGRKKRVFTSSNLKYQNIFFHFVHVFLAELLIASTMKKLYMAFVCQLQCL